MDMVSATGTNISTLTNSTTLTGVTLVGKQFTTDFDFESPAHGYIMAATVFIFVPLLILHIVSGKNCLSLTGTIVGVLAVLGLILGVWSSVIYNRVCFTFTVSFKNVHWVSC